MKILVATALVIALGTASASAQSTLMRSNQGATSFPMAAVQISPRVMASYMQSSGQKLQKIQGYGLTTGVQEIPPTDCPPAPTQECLDSWDIKTIDPFE